MDQEMEGWKLFRRLKDGQLHPLFINKSMIIKPGVWLPAEDRRTSGYAHRPGWHATLRPVAPHLRQNGNREWVRVLLRGIKLYDRPESQGGTWVLAQEMMVIES